MSAPPAIVALEVLRGLRWLVTARNEIQKLMLGLYERFDGLKDDQTREFALGIAFSLWRAVFLIHEKEIEAPLAEVDDPDAKRMREARAFLKRVIEANAIGFPDDDRHRAWTAGYYVNNAVYRTFELKGSTVRSANLEVMSLRQWWNWAYYHLTVLIDTDGPE